MEDLLCACYVCIQPLKIWTNMAVKYGNISVLEIFAREPHRFEPHLVFVGRFLHYTLYAVQVLETVFSLKH